MTIEQLRAAYGAAIERARALRDRIDAADATDDLDALGVELDEASAEIERTKTNLDAREKVERVLADNPIPEVVHARAEGRVSVGHEELTYREDDAARGRSFFGDAFRAQFAQDAAAAERLARNGQEQAVVMRERGVQTRDVGTSAFAGLTIPQYLVDLYAPLARAGAPLLTAIRKLPLPASGMTVNISRATTGTAVAVQAAENDAVQETNFDDTLLTINVRTYAGMQDVSRQALERSEMVDQVIYEDLISDYFTKVDSGILNDDGTSGTHLGIRSTSSIIAVTYTDASPTVGELYPKVADAIQQIATNRYAPALMLLMHPRRWGWETAALDSTGRPLVVTNAAGPWNALAVGQAPEYGAVVGSKQGLPVITDANIPTNLGAGTNEDMVFALRTPDLIFWQDGDGAPRRFQFEQSNAPQSVRLAVMGYSAFTAGRYPKGVATIGGTGLVTPTF